MTKRPAFLTEAPFVLAVLAVAVSIRLGFVLAYDFPLNDGGMFHSMAQDIQRAGYALPAFTSYNGQDIPFAYPPLALYMAALLDDLTPLSLLDIVRFLPLTLSILGLPLIYLLFRTMLPSRMAACIAIVAFILMPRSHAWLLVGGGLTRATGLLFAAPALLAMYLLFTKRDLRYLWAAVPLAALSVLSHPEIGWFTAFSTAILCVFYGLHRQGILGMAILGAGVLLLTAPWWETVLLRHGLGPMLAAASTGNHHEIKAFLLSLLEFRHSEEGNIPLLAVLGVVGVFPAIARHLYVLPVWLVALFILEPRSAATYATIPLAMLIGLLFAHLIIPLVPWRALLQWPRASVRDRFDRDGAGSAVTVRMQARWRPYLAHWTMAGACALVFGYLLWLGFTTVKKSNSEILEAVSPRDQDAMAWVRENTDPESRFAVLTYEYWADDSVTEWFPALSERQSISTAQGKEWLPGQDFQAAIAAHDGLAICSLQNVGCIEDWAAYQGTSYDYVYLSAGCCSGELIGALSVHPAYRMVFGNGAVGIWKHEPGRTG